ncbi:MAG: PIN domain-containing protein [Verrucomicrobia bacterium]|nr:PIN domain-containing protein [Verrucomicrobiota bacterium]MDE3098941.1 PIN domain-containing protein [Verrucomicrobiota bacterium]
MTNRVFLDASFWVTYRSENEAHQPEAADIVRELLLRHIQFVTTLPVLCEIHAAFSRNSRKRALVLGDLWQNPVVKIEEITHRDQTTAMEILRLHPDKTYSLCDALSFAVMRRLGVSRAASYDKHFRQIGGIDVIPLHYP